jgi:hypothetical protein
MFETVRQSLYHRVRPYLLRGEKTEIIQNEETVGNAVFSDFALKLEADRYSHKNIMNRYINSLLSLLRDAHQELHFKQVLDIGTADGEIISIVAQKFRDCNFRSVDLMEEAVQLANKRHGSIKNLSFEQQNFLKNQGSAVELVMCLQTLEHIGDEELETFFTKLFQVSEKAVLLSVPREPFWCMANLLRFKYLNRIGNTYHHVQHWTKSGFIRQARNAADAKWGRNNYILYSKSPLFLWTLVIAIKCKSTSTKS